MPLNAQIMLSILAHETSTGDLSKTLRATPASYAATLTDGTGANQAQVVWSDARTIAANTTDQPHSQQAGMAGFVDERGSVSFSSVKCFYIRNTGATSIGVQFIDWESGPPIGEEVLPPGAVIFLSRSDAAGWVTTGGYLQLVNFGSQPSSCEVVLIGEGTIT